MNWLIVSNIASISTLILFVIYFLGRIWSILQSKNEIEVVFDRKYKSEFKIINEFRIGCNNREAIYLTANNTLIDVAVYKCEFNAETGKVSKGDKVCDCGQLGNGFTFKFNAYFVEVIPEFMIEYQANDFTKGRLLFSENLYNGVLGQNTYRMHTFKSVLYYLFK